MNKRYIAHVSGILLSLIFVLTQFQNCTPVDPEANYGEVDGEMRVIDDWNAQKVAFIASDLSLNALATQVTVDGFCPRKAVDLEVSWHLVDDSHIQLDLDNGYAECEGGGFRFVLENLDQLECDKDYSILAGYDGIQEADMNFRIECDTTKSAQSD